LDELCAKAARGAASAEPATSMISSRLLIRDHL
jgi:hypothetical protein